MRLARDWHETGRDALSKKKAGSALCPWEKPLVYFLNWVEYSCIKFALIATHQVQAMAAITTLNPKAEVARAAQALAINISAAKGIQDVLKTNLGPKGTMKM